jgi:hypothetical protein
VRNKKKTRIARGEFCARLYIIRIVKHSENTDFLENNALALQWFNEEGEGGHIATACSQHPFQNAFSIFNFQNAFSICRIVGVSL